MRRFPLASALTFVVASVVALPVFLHADDELPTAVRITAEYQDHDVRKVVADIAMKAEANLIISPQFEGTITVKFHEAPWRAALEQVVRTTGFALVEEDYDILRVVAGASEPGTDYYRFRHRLPGAAPQQGGDPSVPPVQPPLVAAIQRILDREHCQIRYIPAQSTVIYTGSPDALETVRAILSAFDQPPVVETTGAIRGYERLLAEARTEMAAKYFLRRLEDLRKP